MVEELDATQSKSAPSKARATGIVANVVTISVNLGHFSCGTCGNDRLLHRFEACHFHVCRACTLVCQLRFARNTTCRKCGAPREVPRLRGLSVFKEKLLLAS